MSVTTQKHVAAHLFISTRMVRQLVEEGVFEQPLDLDRCREVYLDRLRTAAGRGDSQLGMQRARLAAAQAYRAERENAAAEGSTIDAAEVTAVLSDLFKHFSRRLRALPSAAVTALGLTPAQSRKLLAMIDRVLNDLSRYDFGAASRRRSKPRDRTDSRRAGRASAA